MSKGFLHLSSIELRAIPSAKRFAMVQIEAVKAIKLSIRDGNTTPANLLVKILPKITIKKGAKNALIKYFEKWGNLRYSETEGTLSLERTHPTATWTEAYEAELNRSHWDVLLEECAPSKSPYVDAEKEIRKVIERLERVNEDPEQQLVHPLLVTKIRSLLWTYGASETYDLEEKRGRTLFDIATARSTM